jgi:hypothetical protein
MYIMSLNKASLTLTCDPEMVHFRSSKLDKVFQIEDGFPKLNYPSTRLALRLNYI